ncbi:MAG: hypothetical protein Q7U91_05835 [Sideroxyarcus sp.]|nr:hypothetical protein [Sideroxyarcus sp.]
MIEQPLDTETIRSIKKLSADNRAAYNKVFNHTPRNEFTTLTQGRRAYYTGKDDTKPTLSILPALQTTYMKAGKHDVSGATSHLKSTVIGFWVEIPLLWGTDQKNTPTPPADDPSVIASNSNANDLETANT